PADSGPEPAAAAASPPARSRGLARSCGAARGGSEVFAACRVRILAAGAITGILGTPPDGVADGALGAASRVAAGVSDAGAGADLGSAPPGVPIAASNPA